LQELNISLLAVFSGQVPGTQLIYFSKTSLRPIKTPMRVLLNKKYKGLMHN
jgi:hypothetical protein